MIILFNLAVILALVPLASIDFDFASIRRDGSGSLFSACSISSPCADSGSIGAAGSGSDVTGTSIAGSTSGVADGSGAVGAVSSGSIGSAGADVTGSKNAIASLPNCAPTAALNVPISVGST